MGIAELDDKIDVSKKYDQYCHYENLPKLLKRFSFDAKMRVATELSGESILFERIKRGNNENTALPWCLETFVMLSMEANEYAYGSFDGKSGRKFEKIYNSIWAASDIVLEACVRKFDFIDFFFAVTALNQFHLQESFYIKRYRFWRVFNDNTEPVFMKDVFKQKMGTEYEEFLLLGHIMQVIFVAKPNSKQLEIPQRLLWYLLKERFCTAAKHLMVSRKEYVALQKRFVKDSTDPYKYVYSLCPSCQYAFVEEKGSIYFPLPHLFEQCVTSSLLYRITEGDNDLREKIGKHVWERYLKELISDAEIYDEVFPEQEYRHNGSRALSPDILARKDEDVLLIESKSTTPRNGIRLFDEADYESNVRIVAGNIVKLYKQMRLFDIYNPFKGKTGKGDSYLWGIVTVLEDSYIRRSHYFERAGEQLGIAKDSTEWSWLTTHIKVISLYEIERLSISGNSLIDACKATAKDNPFNFTFGNYPIYKNEPVNKKYLAFNELYDQKANDICKELLSKDFFQ